ncbi:MAG: hypothetical protein V1745_02590, partial [Patescibacteria group bacterium]
IPEQAGTQKESPPSSEPPPAPTPAVHAAETPPLADPTPEPELLTPISSDDFRNLYVLNERPEQQKVLGIATSDQVNQWVHNMYIALLVLLTSSLLLALAFRFKVHHVATLAHAMAVIGFTTTLMLWS